MKPVHPGRVLKRELAARRLSANALAIALRTPSGRITDILNGKRGVSPETAMRLARYFGNSARFWLNLQTAYELAVAEAELGERIASEVTPAAAMTPPALPASRARRVSVESSSRGVKRRGDPGDRKAGAATSWIASLARDDNSRACVQLRRMAAQAS